MVKVLLFPLYPAHSVVPCAEEPLAVIPAKDVFLVPTIANAVHIIGRKGEAFGHFPTTDPIAQLRYLPSIDATLSIEVGVQKQRYVRIYKNWRPGSAQGLLFTTVNVPASTQVLAVCPATARFAVAWNRAITLYNIRDAATLDVQFLVQVDTSLPAQLLSLHDSYLAYATATELTVLDLLVEPRRVEQGAAALESPMRKQTTVVLDANNNVTSPAGALLSLPSLERSGAVKSQEPVELVGVQLRDLQHAAFANTDAGFELYRCQPILVRRFAATDRISSLGIRGLAALPSPTQLERGELPPVSEVQLFVSTNHCGYLYLLASPSVSRTRLLTTYSYTGDISSVHLGEQFLYSLSRNGLEVWTLRATMEGDEEQPAPCIVTLQNLMYVQQAAVAQDLTVMLLSKSVTDLPVAAAPAQTSSGRPRAKSKPQPLTSSSNRPSAASPPAPSKLAIDDFVLISEREARKPEVAWNIQLLQATPLLALTTEMRAYGTEKAESNPSVFYQFRVEVLLLLASAISSRIATCKTLPPEIEAGAERETLWNEVKELAAEHRKAASELAEHYIQTRSLETAAHVFANSTLPATEVLQRFFASPDAERRLRAVAAYTSRTGRYEVLSKEQADQLLAYLGAHTPGVLPPLLLNLRVPDFDQAALLRALEPVMALEAAASGEMVLTCAMLAFACGNEARGSAALRSLDVDTLYRLLISHPPLLQFREGRTAFWRALSREFPWSLLEAVEKHRSTLTIAQALTVLGGAPLSAGDEAHAQTSDILFLYLLSTLQSGHADATHSLTDTALLLALHLLHDVQSPRSLPPNVLETTVLRKSGSLSSLTPSPKPTPPSSPRSAAAAAEARAVERLRASLLKDRHRWLDSLPPFALQPVVSDPFATPAPSAPPAFFFLRKLQGLLCSSFSQHIDYARFVAAVNDAKNEFPGRFSLRLLCLPRCGALADAVPSLVAAYPSLSADYGETVCQKAEDWAVLCNALLQATVSPDRPIRVAGIDTSPAKFFTAYVQLLEHLTLKLSPAEFVSVLPPNGSVAFFMPFIERCHRQMRAELLRKKIVDEQLAVLQEEEKAAQQHS